MRIPIRFKLLGAVAIPLVTLAGVAYYETDQATDRAAEADTETELAVAGLGPGSLVGALQLERNFTAVYMIGMENAIDLPIESIESARAASDEARASLERYLDESPAAVRDTFEDGLLAMGGVEGELAEIRTEVDDRDGPRDLANIEWGNQLFDRYTVLIDTLLDDTSEIALGVDDAELRTGIELVDLATRAYETRTRIVRLLLVSALSGELGPGTQAEVARLVSESDQIDESLLARSIGPFEGIPELAVLDPQTEQQDASFEDFIETGAVDVAALAADVSVPGDEGYLGMRTQAAQELLEAANVIVASAEDHRLNVLLFSAALGALAIYVTYLATRSITRPLRSLTEQARRMAEERLPATVQSVLDTPLGDDVVMPELEPVVVASRDEVADVARAINTVQTRAVDLAVEQAVLRRNIADSFVNLGRRNQNLVGRQLDFITELERTEADPDVLERLFQLDHLATRMRRNADSLFRLAGGEATASWDGPVTMLDVVRGALGEVEDFKRVDIRQVDQAALGSGVGADLSHALAELIENAISFSPPGERVEVRGRVSSEGYVLAVIDNGVGMSPTELERANRRLSGEESFTVAPSRYLGHYVAGHLTSKLGISTQLHTGVAGGIVARLYIPTKLLLPGDQAPRTTPEATTAEERPADRTDGFADLLAAPPERTDRGDRADRAERVERSEEPSALAALERFDATAFDDLEAPAPRSVEASLDAEVAGTDPFVDAPPFDEPPSFTRSPAFTESPGRALGDGEPGAGLFTAATPAAMTPGPIEADPWAGLPDLPGTAEPARAAEETGTDPWAFAPEPAANGTPMAATAAGAGSGAGDDLLAALREYERAIDTDLDPFAPLAEPQPERTSMVEKLGLGSGLPRLAEPVLPAPPPQPDPWAFGVDSGLGSWPSVDHDIHAAPPAHPPATPAAPAARANDDPLASDWFGGLAPVSATSSSPDRTASGLKRRTPATRPATAPAPARAPLAPAPARATLAPGSTPDEVMSFLADFTSGVDRGLEEAQAAPIHDLEERWG